MKHKNLFTKEYDSEEEFEDDDEIWTPSGHLTTPKKLCQRVASVSPKVTRKTEIPQKKKVNFYTITFLDKPYESIAKYIIIPSTWIYRFKFIEDKETSRVAVLYPHTDRDPILTNYRVRTKEKRHVNWKMYMADIIHKSATYEDAKSWINKKKNENSSDTVASLKGSPLESAVSKKTQDGLKTEKTQIKPSSIRQPNRIEQPIIQLERLELEGIEDEDTDTEIYDLDGTIEITDNLYQEEPAISMSNELTKSPAINSENSSEHCTRNKFYPKILSIESLNVEKSSTATNITSNDDKRLCQVSKPNSHPKSVILPAPHRDVQKVSDNVPNKFSAINAKPQPDNIMHDQIKKTSEQNHEYPLLFFPACTSYQHNNQPQGADVRNFTKIVTSQKRQYQESIANAPTSTHRITNSITIPAQAPLTKRNNPTSTHTVNRPVAKKPRFDINIQHIYNIQELINTTVQKSLPDQNSTENTLLVNTTQNNIERYFPNMDRPASNIMQTSAAKTLANLAQQSRLIEYSQKPYNHSSSKVRPDEMYRMQHNKLYHDVLKKPHAVQKDELRPPAAITSHYNEVHRNMDVSTDRITDNIVDNRHFQTRFAVKNNVVKKSKNVQNNVQGKVQIKSTLAAEQEMLDAFSALFVEMASNLNYAANVMYNNTLQTSISEINETNEFLQKKIDSIKAIEKFIQFSEKTKSTNVRENILMDISDMNEDKSSNNKNNNRSVDDCGAVRKHREHTRRRLILPPEYDPNDSKWTLKYREKEPGLVELVPGYGIYVNKLRLKKILRTSTDRKSLTLLLLTEIFSRNALSVCSLTGARAMAYGSQIEYIRPGLDEHAKDVMLYFVEQYAAKRSSQMNWEDPGNLAIMNALRCKLHSTRDKWGKMVTKS